MARSRKYWCDICEVAFAERMVYHKHDCEKPDDDRCRPRHGLVSEVGPMDATITYHDVEELIYERPQE